MVGSTVVTEPAQAASVVMVPLAPTVTAAQQVARFWLADGAANLKNATPYAVRTTVGGERLSTDIVPDGPPASIPPLEEPASPDGELPTTSGKVFFIGSDLQPHWCTGTAVRSKYRNVVATAGHCLLDRCHRLDGPVPAASAQKGGRGVMACRPFRFGSAV
ncbi:hypothetical protein SAMN05216275_117138 [Streptosporangium canum]|uniref:Trypsin n=1 Tax=Streptosporangium canum TaxID=324952 RepID=A0A1I3WV34_9ACTN|nr:hypothetical protein [Streptosporangium canum]SFK11019.1 hypothetical protein SAMN05216275_117138 [Streptosporangium canum]